MVLSLRGGRRCRPRGPRPPPPRVPASRHLSRGQQARGIRGPPHSRATSPWPGHICECPASASSPIRGAGAQHLTASLRGATQFCPLQTGGEKRVKKHQNGRRLSARMGEGGVERIKRKKTSPLLHKPQGDTAVSFLPEPSASR